VRAACRLSRPSPPLASTLLHPPTSGGGSRVCPGRSNVLRSFLTAPAAAAAAGLARGLGAGLALGAAGFLAG